MNRRLSGPGFGSGQALAPRIATRCDNPTTKTVDPGGKTMEKTMTDRKGEGSYDGAEQYQKDQHSFAKSGQVEKKAREASEALDGKEGAELEKARRETADKQPG